MTKILKKSLACLLAFVLCFTAIAGCLAVSAEELGCSADFKTWFANDTKVWQVCSGNADPIRAQVTVAKLKAGTTYGISLELPDNIEITNISHWAQSGSAQEISRFYDEEADIITFVMKATADGTTNHTFVRYRVTEDTPKGVQWFDCTVEAAMSSDGELFTTTIEDYFEIKNHEAGETVVENEVDATCETAGSYDEVVYCKWGKEEISRNTVTSEALGHAYNEGVIDPDATCTDEGVITYTCANDASHTYTEAISAKGHTFVDGKCEVCGAADPDCVPECDCADVTYKYTEDGVYYVTTAVCSNPDCKKEVEVARVTGITIKTALATSDGLLLRYRVNEADVAGYTGIYAEVSKDEYNVSEYKGISSAVVVNSTYDSKNKRFECEYTGISAREMTCKTYASVYGVNADGHKVLLSKIEYVFADYFTGTYNMVNDKFKTFFADIMAYGTAAQRYANYNLNNPLPETYIPMDKASPLPETFTDTVNNSTGVKIDVATSLGSKVTFKYRILKSLVSDYDKNDLRLEITYIDGNGATQTEVVQGSTFGTNGTGANEKWEIQFDKLSAKHVTDVNTIKLYVAGQAEAIGTLEYGFQYYAEDMVGKLSSTPSMAGLLVLIRTVVAYSKSAGNL